MAAKKALEWLLEEDQPSVRYLALTGLLGKPEKDPEVRAAKAAIPARGWAHDLLAKQDPGGWWVAEKSLYRPKYVSTNWMLLVLADLGMTKEDPRIARACELWMARFTRPDGGFWEGGTRGHLCTTGNTARALVQFGYADDPRVQGAFEWLARNRDKNGGWSCFGKGRNLDSWEPMSAFAVYPRARWTEEMEQAVRLGAEFFLSRELHRQGDEYPPWYRFHYPVHYYYDLLVGLDFMTALGYGRDPRMQHALAALKEKRRPDGRWNLDAIQHDLEGKMAEYYARDPPEKLALETAAEPSKMITLRAMRVLHRIGEPV